MPEAEPIFFPKTRDSAVFPVSLLLILLIFSVILYGPRVGKGFVSDDFNWLDNAAPGGKVNLVKPFVETTGFYRPLVSLSFGIQYMFSGLDPRPYGIFNLVIHLLNIILVYGVLSTNEKTRRLALPVVILFALNAKAARMAVGWISSRTMSLSAFFLLAALLFHQESKKRTTADGAKPRIARALTGVSFLAALLCHEGAIAAPLFLFARSFFSPRLKERFPALKARFNAAFESIVAFAAPLTVYFFLRVISDAVTPANAPSYYRYSFSPLLLLKNLTEYFFRAGLLDVIVLFLFAAAMIFLKQKPSFKGNRSLFLLGISWFLLFLSPMLLLPVRSDLYVYFCQVGLHIAFISTLIPLWQNEPEKALLRKKRIVPVLAVLLTGWSISLFLAAGAIETKGAYSAGFVGQATRIFQNLAAETGVSIIEAQANAEPSLANTVSSGFSSMLRLYFPGRKFKGEIIDAERFGKKSGGDGARYFLWKKDQLTGPFPYDQAKSMLKPGT